MFTYKISCLLKNVSLICSIKVHLIDENNALILQISTILFCLQKTNSKMFKLAMLDTIISLKISYLIK